MPSQHMAYQYRTHAAVLRELADETLDEDHKRLFRRAAEYYELKSVDLDREWADSR